MSSTIPSTPVRNRSLTQSHPSPRTPSSTPSTPYTTSQFSGRSFSSILTASSSVNNSPLSSLFPKSTKSIADLTENWRERAKLNGIKVSPVDLDEETSKGFLPSPGFSSNLRRSFKLSPFSSPLSSARRSSSAFNTPLSKTNVHQFRGSYTEPPQPRRHHVYNPPFPDTNEDDAVDGLCSSDSPSHPVFPKPAVIEEPPIISPAQDSIAPCSVCDKQPSSSSRMIVLSPCSHVFCATCFTGTLNIVGEKNMSCMECHSAVESFHFALCSVNGSPPDAVPGPAALLNQRTGLLCSSAVVPKSELSSLASRKQHDSTAVLRIDNVPWDITPLAIRSFIKHPIIRAHVLLDVNGKTLSHAFVQLLPEDARAALRSSQNAILGQGRRARAVTVTLSSQQELMAALYPHWRGNFDGYKPSLDGLDNEQVNEALHRGLISNAILDSLITLISNPNSHFLKVPLLPYYSLISILSTFPSDVDSRVFWSCQLRDALFRITHVAFKIFASRKEKSEEELYIWKQLKDVGMNCRAFTDSQITALALAVVVNHTNIPLEENTTNLKLSADAPTQSLHFESPPMFETPADRSRLEPALLTAILHSS